MNETLRLYRDLVLEKNRYLNLTAIKNEAEFDERNIADSLIIRDFHTFQPGEKVIDLGTGAGLPGIPIAICEPDISVTLVDARKKKIVFLKELIQKLHLENADAVSARVEDLAKDQAYRAKYDAVVTRAVAPLNVLLEYGVPFLKKDGLLFAYKGPKGDEELKDAQRALKELHTIHTKTYHYSIGDAALSIMVFKKRRETPEKYPRAPGVPSKRPL